jgi:tetratricopeptide (TPR) repeat protein
VTLVLGYVIRGILLPPTPAVHELAILPFSVEPAADSTLSVAANSLRDLTWVNLRHFAHLAPPPTVDALVQLHDGSTPAFGERELRRLGVQYAARGAVTAAGDSIVIAISVIDSLGEWTDAGSVRELSQPLDLAEIAHQISFRIAQVVDPSETYEGSDITGRSNAAIVAFVAGRRAFKRNDIRQAVQQFRGALAEDPNFGLAAWWLANVWRWQGTGAPCPDVDLTELLETHGAKLSERERQLIQAQLAPTPERRFEIYHELVQNDPRDAYVVAMYSEELFNRGAFVGIPNEFVVRQLEEAVGKDSSFGPALGSLAYSYIRLGNQSAATSAVESYSAHYYPNQQDPEGEFDRFNPNLLQWAIAERFFPAVNKIAMREHMLARPEIYHALPHASRLASYLGLPETQADIALAVLSDGRDFSTEDRANLHESRALGLVALGRIVEALEHFDSAAALRNTPSAQLEAEEWPIVTTTLGLPPDELRPPNASIDLLESLTDDSSVAFRAAWALGLEALNKGQYERSGRFRALLQASPEDTTAERLGSLLNALELASSGQFRDALSETRGLLAHDSAARGGDPFARAVLHMKRADWLDSLDRPEAADSMRLWYEHFEMIRPFEGEAQAAEIDWALGPYAMWQRGTAAAARQDRQRACALLPRVVELWSESDDAFRSLRDSAVAIAQNLGCR